MMNYISTTQYSIPWKVKNILLVRQHFFHVFFPPGTSMSEISCLRFSPSKYVLLMVEYKKIETQVVSIRLRKIASEQTSNRSSQPRKTKEVSRL